MAVAFNRTLDIHILNSTAKLKFPSSDIIGRSQCIFPHGIKHEEYNSRTIREHRQQLFCKCRRHSYFVLFASANNDVTPNGAQQKNSSTGMEEFTQSEISTTILVQSIHDAARYVELAICEYSSSSKTSWFSKSWLGVDKNAWIKTLSYQVSVYALLQAVIEISSREESGDQDTNTFVKRSLLRQCTSLESVIREELSTKQRELYEWYWSQQHNMVVKMYIDLLGKDPKFSPTTTLYRKGESSSINSGTSLVLLALSCLAAIKHLGSAKVSCSQFFSMLFDTIGRLMDMLVDFVPIQKTYNSMKDIGLGNEFLFHFGPRAASVKYNNDNGAEEMAFWINLVQNQLKMAIDREKIWSKLRTSESIEVLERDLAIFGFFIALGRSTKSFLSTNGVSLMNHQIESLLRFLIGGSVLYYPQLSSISSYQLYVEVVCEELEWLPFYPKVASEDSEPMVKGGMSYKELSVVLDVCSYWMTSFIKYSAWLENPSNIKATRFLSKGHSKLIECMKDVGISEMNAVEEAGSQGSETAMPFEKELDYFDKALESVEEALNKLEILLQELHLSNSNTNKDDLKAACSELERLRKLKKEAEFLEASLRAKAASLGQGNLDEVPPSSTNKWRWLSNKKAKESESSTKRTMERSGKETFWGYLVPNSSRKNGSGVSAVGQNESGLDEIRRFELLRCELIELGKRVQKSTDSKSKEESEFENRIIASTANNEQKKDDVIAKSIEKIKETSTDVLQGTQLLAIDVAAAMVLLRRAITGDELAEKEKKALQRTLTDLASVIPIGILMLLPVTAVGHAAMLAAIQRYAPSLIPSTYGPERLDLLRQLEKVKETEMAETSSDEMTEAINTASSNNPE